MSDVGWTSAVQIVLGLGSIVATIAGFLTVWLKLRYGVEKAEEAATKAKIVENKIDDNTKITKAGTTAVVAATTENKTATQRMVDTVNKKLNGGIDEVVSTAISPIQRVVEEHTSKIEELNDYVHKRNHEMVNVLQSQNNKLDVILQLVKKQSGEK